MKLRSAFLLVIAVIAVAGAAVADVVVMRDGRELEGRIIRETDESLTLQLKYGEVEIRKSMISQIRRGPTALDEYRKKAAGAGDSAQAQYELAQWCAEKGLSEEAKKHYGKALEIDPGFSPAGKALGYEEVDGRWLSPDDAKRARGLVRFEGKWLTKEERDSIVAERVEEKQQELRQEYGVGPGFFVSRRKASILISDLPEEKREKLQEAAEALHAALKERFGQFFVKGRDWPLVIYIFSSREDYRAKVKDEGLDAALDSYGYYSGKKQKSYLFECSSPQTISMLLHEFTHQIYVERMMKRGALAHAWIFEGLAEYYEGHGIENGRLGKARAHLVNMGTAKNALQQGGLIAIEKIIGVDDLSELFDGDYETQESYIAYAQAWAMVYYLLEGDGGKHRQKFERFMKKDLQGEGTPEEFKRIFGADLAKFEEKFKKFLKRLD